MGYGACRMDVLYAMGYGPPMARFRITLTGTHSLLMHNTRLANPLDPIAKEMKRITSKRTKTDDDHAALAHVEFLGGLYVDDVVGPFIPGQNIERCLVDAARTTRAGKKIERGVFVETDVNPLGFTGPRKAEELWDDPAFRHIAPVKVGTSRVMRCRPKFDRWVVEAEGTHDPTVISLEELAEVATTAGLMIGLGDYRPRYGRFTAAVEALAA